MTQYLVQNYNQVIDLFETVELTAKVNLVVVSDAPFNYLLVSREQLDNLDLSSVTFHSANEIRQTVDVNSRYLLVKAENPTVITVHRAIAESIAEMFSSATAKTSSYLLLITFAWTLFLIFMAFIVLTIFKFKKITVRSPLGEAYNAYKTKQGSPVTTFIKTLAANTQQAYQGTKDFYNSTTTKRSARSNTSQ